MFEESTIKIDTNTYAFHHPSDSLRGRFSRSFFRLLFSQKFLIDLKSNFTKYKISQTVYSLDFPP